MQRCDRCSSCKPEKRGSAFAAGSDWLREKCDSDLAGAGRVEEVKRVGHVVARVREDHGAAGMVRPVGNVVDLRTHVDFNERARRISGSAIVALPE